MDLASRYLGHGSLLVIERREVTSLALERQSKIFPSWRRLISGIVRLTTMTPDKRDSAAAHISYSDEDGEVNEYASKIQIAELNALNAVMAVMRWKRLFGIYADRRKDWYAGYSIPSGEIIMEGPAASA